MYWSLKGMNGRHSVYTPFHTRANPGLHWVTGALDQGPSFNALVELRRNLEHVKHGNVRNRQMSSK